jgi:hypothetical protein
MVDATSEGGSQGAVEQGKEQVQAKAGELGDRLQQTARDQIDQRSTEAGERVQTFSSDLRSVGERLREDGNDGPAKVAEHVADRAGQLGGYLGEADANRLLADIEDFGRRQPWIALVSGIALGVVSARLLKASSSSRYRSRQESPGSTGASPVRTTPEQIGAGQPAAQPPVPQAGSPVGATP